MMNHMNTASERFCLPARDAKPRSKGLTSVIDFGPDGFGWTGPQGVRDLMAVAAEYIDFVKIYAMNALLIPKPVVTEIISIYQEHGVTPYAGGILFEHAVQRDDLDGYLAHLQAIGIKMAEISENYVTLSDEMRYRSIDRLQAAGIEVIYEFGLKNPTEPLDLQQLEDIVLDSLGRGIGHVILEQSELDCLRDAAPERLDDLAAKDWFSRTFIEADPYAFPRQHVDLLAKFGQNANLANIGAGQVLRLEGMRRGIGRSVNYAMFS